ncbi:hypothetical protein FKX85_19645 [Echinicola soli]|uniref:Uncharacterized protein n=1 Tax=Echinicola soli TaxID=2591634 RepID=A0A514CMR5_9BACT|nr:hypothetical protein [Echinicola soli]QDH81123.1 hypothetical protein FKX85_19645 [Echinicola soli]
MKIKYVIYVFCLLAIGYLSYHYPLFAFALLALLAGVLLYMVVSGTVWFLKKGLTWKRFQVPLVMVGTILFGLAVGLLSPLPEPIGHSGNTGEDLEQAYITDQGDRMNIRFFVPHYKQQMQKRDSIRLEKVREYLEMGKVDKPIDKFHAAFILHHNRMRDSSLYELAYNLAKQAAAAPNLAANYQAQWLAKATYDRWMLSIGKPQKFGTQGGVSFTLE